MAQDPLYLVDEETTVRGISFKFSGTQSFSEDQLEAQIATTEPGFWDQVQKVLPLLEPAPHPFDPVQLQRDVIRLRRYYRQNGFLHPEIDYRASQLDTSRNTIHLIFSIAEGPPLIIQDVSFVTPEGENAYYELPDELRRRWSRFRDEVSVNAGERFVSFDLLRVESELTRWLQNAGYAFALVDGEADVDSLDNLADLTFLINSGPVAYVDSIIVEGNESVDRSVILRELPFGVGDRFSFAELLQGQRELFGLQLFRVALTEVPPEQPRDSTVTVRVRVREARPRYVSAQGGYARENGIQARGQWTHRNFLGGARVFQAGIVAETGLAATPVGYAVPGRTFNGTVSLRQPYLFTTKLSGTIAPFIQFEQNPQFVNTNEFLNLNTREIGINTSLIYEFFPFRTLTLQHTYVRALILSRPIDFTETEVPLGERISDPHNRSIFSLSGIFGDVDDYITPRNGWLLRPFAEVGGAVLGSDVEYYKLGSEALGYVNLAERFGLPTQYGLAGRLFGGQVWPIGKSRSALVGDVSLEDSIRFEQRFDPILFYAGGPTLRGWGFRLAGPKDPKILHITYEDSSDVRVPTDTLFTYEARGGTALLGANLEVRLPFPGLGENWGTAVFFDAAALGDKLKLSNVFADVGTGIRYRTPVGYIRLDLALKLNPTVTDLRTPRDEYRFRRYGIPPDEKWIRRFNLQLGIGHAF